MKENVAVLMGGRSLERDVSLKSGHRVYEALREKGYEVSKLDVDENLIINLKQNLIDLVYIALHGKYGEDGTVQELLEIMGIPYTGPGVYASTVGFDKALAKEIFRRKNVPTPDFFTLSAGSFREMGAAGALDDVVGKLGLPIVVKPAGQGSALGIKIAHSKEELPGALIGALSYDDKVVLEKYIKGTEVSVSVIGSEELEALPVIEVSTQSEFFDFESMYTMGKAEYFIPARLPDKLIEKVQETAIRVHSVLDCRDVSRIDIIVGEDGMPYVLELNTSPGMTETSLLPMAAAARGIEFSELVDMLVGFALKRR
ncbi:MAG: D-alanine--D-alanine ligase [Actinobacteria bacterium]|nr:D-alanine--D-alanine ligase [Actinomycetota bacterium]